MSKRNFGQSEELEGNEEEDEASNKLESRLAQWDDSNADNDGDVENDINKQHFRSSYYKHNRYRSIRNKLPERKDQSVVIKAYRLKICKEILETIQPPSLFANIEEEKRKRKKKKSSSGNDEETKEEDVDSGYAWVILAVMFVINASTFGTARAYGLIFEKLAREDEQSRSQAALPFTIMGAIENMGGPLTGYLLARTCSWRLTVLMGSSLITMSHLLAAYFSSLLGQMLTIGLMCGVGLSFVTISSFQINNAHFVRYRSRAFGFCLTGAAFGALYISPLCEYVLDNSSTKDCYLLLSLILFPNVPLSLLLKPKQARIERKESDISHDISIISKSSQISDCESAPAKDGFVQDARGGLWNSIIEVVTNPLFHLIWPTQLLFCWFNFVYGMIIVDFGKDRGFDSTELSQLIPVWAIGQLVGRIGLGSLVDLGIFSYKSFTVICFVVISLATWSLDNIQIGPEYQNLVILVLIFILSTFISNLYILLNGLVVNYMEESQITLAFGISSFTGSFFLLPRAYIIGHYRDISGNYDTMLTMFTYVSMAAALIWIILPDLLHKSDHQKLSLVNLPKSTFAKSNIISTNVIGKSSS